jgi:hypothetical protein
MKITAGSITKTIAGLATVMLGGFGLIASIIDPAPVLALVFSQQQASSWASNYTSQAMMNGAVSFAVLMVGLITLLRGRGLGQLGMRVFNVPGIKFQAWRFGLPTINQSMKLPKVGKWQAPTFNISLPKFAGLQVKGGVWKVIGIATIIGGLATVGIFFATTARLDASPIYPDAAVYDAGQAFELNKKELVVGTKNEFDEDTPIEKRHTQTLRIILSGARISTLNFENISLGKATGLATGLLISGTTANTLICEEIEIDGLETPSFMLEQSRVYQLVVSDNAADGLSFSPSLSSTVASINVGSSRGALSIPDVSDSSFDRLLLDTQASDAVCEKLVLKNIKLWGTYSDYAVILRNIDAGKLTIKNSIIGDGTGINSASMHITSTSSGLIQLSNNTERPISIR